LKFYKYVYIKITFKIKFLFKKEKKKIIINIKKNNNNNNKIKYYVKLFILSKIIIEFILRKWIKILYLKQIVLRRKNKTYFLFILIIYYINKFSTCYKLINNIDFPENLYLKYVFFHQISLLIFNTS